MATILRGMTVGEHGVWGEGRASGRVLFLLQSFSRTATRDDPPHKEVGDPEEVELPCVGCGRFVIPICSRTFHHPMREAF